MDTVKEQTTSKPGSSGTTTQPKPPDKLPQLSRAELLELMRDPELLGELPAEQVLDILYQQAAGLQGTTEEKKESSNDGLKILLSLLAGGGIGWYIGDRGGKKKIKALQEELEATRQELEELKARLRQQKAKQKQQKKRPVNRFVFLR